MKWEQKRIREFADVYDGPHATPKESTSGNIFLGIKNIKPEGGLDLKEIRYISEDEFEKWTKRVTPSKDDIVLSYEATLHRYAIIPENFLGCLGRRMALVRVKENMVYHKFIYYTFLSDAWRGFIDANKLTGATVDRISITDFPDYKINLPPLPTQRKIASILSAYDDLIENNLKRIKLLEEKALMEYRILFYSSKLKEYPLEEVWEIKYGKNLPQTKITESGKYPVYGAAGKIGFYEDFNYEFPVALVTSRGNGSGVAHRANQAAFITNNSFAFVPKFNFREIHFHLAEMILSDLELTQLRSGTAQPQLTIAGLIGVKLKLPKQELLIEYNNNIDPVFNLIFTLEKQNTKLSEARDILLPRLMNGTIEV